MARGLGPRCPGSSPRSAGCPPACQRQAQACHPGAASSYLFSFLSWETGCSCRFPESMLTGSWKHHLTKQAVPQPARQRRQAPRLRQRETPRALSSRLRPGSEGGAGILSEEACARLPSINLPQTLTLRLSPLKQVDAVGQESKFGKKITPCAHTHRHVQTRARAQGHTPARRGTSRAPSLRTAGHLGKQRLVNHWAEM